MKVTFTVSFFESLEKLGMTDDEKEQFIQEIHDKFSNRTAEELQEQSGPLTEEEMDDLGLRDFDPATYSERTIN